MIKPNTARGFTIVEVMIALAVIASLTALMWVSISQMYKTRDIVEMRAERFQAVRITLGRMTQELSSAYIAGPEFGGEFIPGEEPTISDSDSEEDAADIVMPEEDRVQFGMIGRDDEIHFTTFAHMRTFEGEKASYSTEIGYFIRSQRNDEGELVKVLMRRSDTTHDDDITRGGVVYKIFEEVDDIKFEYWDAGATKIGDLEEIAEGRWVDRWDTTRREFAGRLPTRIRVTLSLPPQGPTGSMETFTTQTQIHITEVLEY